MTTSTARRSVPPAATSVPTLWPVLRLRLRRDRVQVPVWLLALGVIALLSGIAVPASFGTVADRQALVQIAVGTPSILMLRGEPRGPAADALLFFSLFANLAAAVAFMSTFLAVRHSRAEEEAGRSELIGATAASRLVPLLATVLFGTVAALGAGAAVALALVVAGLDPTGALVTGAALAGTGAVFLGVGLVAAQLMRTSRGANGLAAAVIGVAYVLRAVGDAGGTPATDGLSLDSAWPSWLSPLGWGQRTRAFTENNPAPLVLAAVCAALLVAVAVLLQSRRDTGSSVFAERAGPPAAGGLLRGSLGLAWRLQRASILGWAITGLLFGLLAGSLGETVVDLMEGNPVFQNVLVGLAGGPGAIIDLFTATLFSLVGVLAAAAAIQVMLRARQEEATGVAEAMLSTSLGRIRWLFDYVSVGLVAIVLVLGGAVVGAAIGLLQTDAAAHRIDSVLRAGAAQLPAALLLLAVAAVLVAGLPRVSIGLSWGLLLVAVVIGQFGDLLDLPGWVQDLSPFSHTPVVAAADVDWSGAWWMPALAVLLVVVAAAGIRRRDLAP
jgi:ABC-2 type transport system permease protein